MKKQSKSDIILGMLKERENCWVSMDRLAREAGTHSVNTRVSELRTLFGYEIENQTYFNKKGVKCSRYKLIGRKEDAA